jgi:hypothetical protein
MTDRLPEFRQPGDFSFITRKIPAKMGMLLLLQSRIAGS